MKSEKCGIAEFIHMVENAMEMTGPDACIAYIREGPPEFLISTQISNPK